MAKEEQATIGFNKSTIALTVLVLAVLSASTFWKDRGGSEVKADVIQEAIVAAHEMRITANATDLKEIRDEQHRAELARTKMDGKVDNIMMNQNEMKEDFKDFKDFLMKYDYPKIRERAGK